MVSDLGHSRCKRLRTTSNTDRDPEAYSIEAVPSNITSQPLESVTGSFPEVPIHTSASLEQSRDLVRYYT
jgi:hypothetical protein